MVSVPLVLSVFCVVAMLCGVGLLLLLLFWGRKSECIYFMFILISVVAF